MLLACTTEQRQYWHACACACASSACREVYCVLNVCSHLMKSLQPCVQQHNLPSQPCNCVLKIHRTMQQCGAGAIPDHYLTAYKEVHMKTYSVSVFWMGYSRAVKLLLAMTWVQYSVRAGRPTLQQQSQDISTCALTPNQVLS